MVVGVLIALWSYYLSLKNYKVTLDSYQVILENSKVSLDSYILERKKALSEQEKSSVKLAIDLCGKFRNEVLCSMEKLFPIEAVKYIKDSHLNKEPSPIEYKIFSREEMEEIYGSGLLNRVDPSDKKQVCPEVNPDEPYSFSADEDIDYCDCYSCATNTLNVFEEFAMYFVTEVADHETAFIPMHNFFLQSVHKLYPYICHYNKNPHNKLYRNTAELYRIWYAKSSEEKNKLNKQIIAANEPHRCINKI